MHAVAGEIIIFFVFLFFTSAFMSNDGKFLNFPTHNPTYDVAWYTHTHTHLTALCPGLPGWASTRKVKPIRIVLKYETVSCSGISWSICKSAPRSRQITMPAHHHSAFTGQVPFLVPNQRHQSTEGNVMA